ncbi:MAG: ABC transporter ATP-binding protein [Hyphomicrobiales bacterium]|nr:ABC transporter ATP-binding protein [Hyphomicrobiales bacterium]
MSTIELKNVSKYFGTLAAVRDADLSVAAGETVCLLGPSGCGKTTTLRIVAGLEAASNGDVFIGGKRVNDLSPADRDIAMVFQFYALYPSLTVAENIAFPLYYERLSKADREARVRKAAETLDLVTVLDRLPGQVAEGEKQRAAVARAIVRDPSCFLFDEPLSRLDVELRQTMRGQIKELLTNLSKATVIVTHDQLEALTMADRIAIMRDGLIEQIASPHAIFSSPANVFVAGFIGTPQMNLIEASFAEVAEGEAEIAFGDQQFRLSVNGVAQALSKSETFTFGIRPRAFTVAAAESEHTISGTVELIEPMGAETLFHVRSGGLEVRVVVPRDIRVPPGHVIHLTCDPGQVRFFDADGRAVQ